MVCKELFCYYSYGGIWLKFYIIGSFYKVVYWRREKEKRKKEEEERSEEKIEKEKNNKKRKKKKKKKNEKGMQLLEGNSCEPMLQRPLACFWNYLCILSFLCFTHSPLAPLQPRLNDQLILGGFVIRMVEFPIDDIFHEIFVLFHCSSFLNKGILHPNLKVNSLDK